MCVCVCVYLFVCVRHTPTAVASEESEEAEEEEEEERRHDAAVSGYESHERLSHCKHACNRDSSRLTWLEPGPRRRRCRRRRCQDPVIESIPILRPTPGVGALVTVRDAPPKLLVLEHRPAFATATTSAAVPPYSPRRLATCERDRTL